MRYLSLLLVMLTATLGHLPSVTYPFTGGISLGGALLASVTGIFELLQTNRSILKNNPLIARTRFLIEGIRP